jgi:predicted amidohydrolase
VALIDRHGALTACYDKVHTCDFSGERWLEPGKAWTVRELDTVKGPVQIGLAICYDREFPESLRLLMLAGAELVLIPNACELERHRRAQIQTRAYENMMGVAVANYSGPAYRGHSVAHDCMAFRSDGSSRDTLVVEAGEAIGLYLARFDLAAIRDWRHRETWGDAYRKRDRYSGITQAAADAVFHRPDAR